jgi:hypothetical protein
MRAPRAVPAALLLVIASLSGGACSAKGLFGGGDGPELFDPDPDDPRNKEKETPVNPGPATTDNPAFDAAPQIDGSTPPPLEDGSSAVDAAPPDPCLGRTVCENFEGVAQGQAPGAPWAVQSSKGSVMVDTTRAHSGTKSLKVSIQATTSGDTYRQAMIAVKGAPLIPLQDDVVYGRFFLWTDRVPDSTVHYTFAGASGSIGSLYAVYNYGGMGGLMANYYKSSSPDPTDCWQTKNSPFPTGAWKCVAFKLDGKNNELRFWLDDVEIPELHVLGNTKTDQTCTVAGVDGRWLGPTFDNVRIGWESYQHDVAGAHEAWVDDVILDDQPINCGP